MEYLIIIMSSALYTMIGYSVLMLSKESKQISTDGYGNIFLVILWPLCLVIFAVFLGDKK